MNPLYNLYTDFRPALTRVSNFWRLAVAILFLTGNWAGAQILTDGGFESGLSSWSSSLSSGGSATFANDFSYPHNGTNCLQVTVSNAGTASNSVKIVSSSFTANSSDTYVLRFWANTSVLDASLGVNLLGATPVYPQIPFEISTNSLASGSEYYQEYRYAFKASGTVSIAFNFQTVATYWLDDVEVLDLTNNDGFDVPMTYLWQWGEWNFVQTNGAKIVWTGGDNDKSCLLPDGSVAWIFNDSYATTVNGSYFYSNIRGSSLLPRNSVVHQIGTNLVWMNNGANTFFVPTNSNNIYWICGGVVETNNLIVLLNEDNADAVTNVNMAVASLSLPGLTLSRITELSSPGSDDFSPFVKGDDGYYYIYNGAKVARVPAGGLAVNSDWTYWNGSTWVTNHTQSVAIANFQGWSVTKVGTSNYCAVYVPELSLNMYVQYAPTPMGPWSSGTVFFSVPDEGGEGISSTYAPNICAGTGTNGIYTIGFSDDGCTESWFTKTASDKSWYNPHFVTLDLLLNVPNSGFETPSLGSGYEYNPSGGSWTFSGASPSGSGLVGNGSGFGNPNAPQGVQAAFVQETGTISQTISGFTSGLNYTISFLAAERLNNSESWNVTVNGTVVASFNPGSSATSYTNYSATFTATAATQTVAFVGTDLTGGDNTVFIDNVRILQ
jgi:hypothetical protein